MLIIDEIDNAWKINLTYLSTAIGYSQAEEIAAGFTALLNFVLKSPKDSVGGALWSLRKDMVGKQLTAADYQY